MRPMHWFWRVTIAMAAGIGVGWWAHFDGRMYRVVDVAWASLSSTKWLHDLSHGPVMSVARSLIVLLAAFGTYGILTRCFGPRKPKDAETRCRSCGFILRGITAARCPECGEPI